MAGCHSHYLPMFREAAEKQGADLYRLILDVSAEDKKAPSRELIDSFAARGAK